MRTSALGLVSGRLVTVALGDDLLDDASILGQVFLAVELEQLNVKDQRGIRRNLGRAARDAIRVVGLERGQMRTVTTSRTPKTFAQYLESDLAPLTQAHRRHSLIPTLDDLEGSTRKSGSKDVRRWWWWSYLTLAKLEGEWIVAIATRVKLGAIQQGARVMNCQKRTSYEHEETATSSTRKGHLRPPCPSWASRRQSPPPRSLSSLPHHLKQSVEQKPRESERGRGVRCAASR